VEVKVQSVIPRINSNRRSKDATQNEINKATHNLILNINLKGDAAFKNDSIMSLDNLENVCADSADRESMALGLASYHIAKLSG